MKWIRSPSERDSDVNKNYYLVSDCRRYTLAKYFDNGEARYELWEGRRLIATRMPSADSCKALLVQREAA